MKGEAKTRLRVGAASHRGRVRAENQDRISRFESPLGQVFLVVDGMGGHGDGGQAAEVAVRVLEGELGCSRLGEEAAFRHAAAEANSQLLALSAKQGEGNRRMGATLVLALLTGRRVRIAHAGDCRAYLQRGGTLRSLTRDHSLVQQMVTAGVLAPAEARHHPDASVVTRALGQEESLDLELAEPLILEQGDRLLLCSDGLCGYLEDREIACALTATEDPQQATDGLIELALAAGGEDNVSVQLIELAPGRVGAIVPESRQVVTPVAPSSRQKEAASVAAIPRTSTSRRVWLWFLLAVIAVALVFLTFPHLLPEEDPVEFPSARPRPVAPLPLAPPFLTSTPVLGEGA